ncbi:DUF6807 family protein [Lunatimonas lonarensis]|uniref:DUF6807 family protein n=1 Tax=Lunatimonas lonarensis TaxID=1232681 RepID=UPI00056AEDD1|nr:DUF6807 family protein [Lunatimonas lonarensis]
MIEPTFRHKDLLASLLIGILYCLNSPCLIAQQLSWTADDQGYELTENGETRLFYQRATKDKDGQYPRANYIHPLYDLNGDVITEDFPEDHLHHRGIFWTWHQLLVDGKRVADPWISDGIVWEVTRVETSVLSEEMAALDAQINWVVDGEPVVEESLRLHYERVDPELYRLTVEVWLKPLAKKVQIGGSEDPKGYGGFSPRIRLTETTGFFDQNGPVTPQELPVAGGPWMNITQQGPEDPGVVILGEPDRLPSYQGWILRRKNSMQNMAFPGREPITLSEKEPYLHFRNQLLVHQGLQTAEIDLFYRDFIQTEPTTDQALAD